MSKIKKMRCVKWKNNTIMMHCKDGKILDIRETDDVDFTMFNILADDWEVANNGGYKVKNI